MIYKSKGRLLVSNINIDFIEVLVNQYPTVDHFLKDIGISYIVLKNIRENGSIKMSTVDKILNRFPNLNPQDLIKDFRKEDFIHFDIDLNKHKPTQEDLNDTVEYLNANQRTIKMQLEKLGVEKSNRVMSLVKRLVMEATYLGILLEKMNKSVKVINHVKNMRTKGD